MINDDHTKDRRSLRPLFPDLSEGELKEIEEIFYGYLEIVWGIFRAIETDPIRCAAFEKLIAEKERRENPGFPDIGSSPLKG